MKYKVSAKSVGFIEATIEAKDEDEAQEILETMLENGELEETDGWIEDKKVEEVK
jgi:predicted 3-demethylubiquinone-9 3-methyltransferase (glyoxalase superfamily)